MMSRYLARVSDDDVFGRLISTTLGEILDGIDNLHTLQNLSENDLVTNVVRV